MAKILFFWGVLVTLAFAGSANLLAAMDYPYAYEFISSNPNVTGEIFLDAPSSNAGSAADIGPGSYLTFNLYNGYIPPVTFDFSSLDTSLDQGLSFSWNASQITTPLDISVGSGHFDVLLNREFENPNETSATSPEMDVVDYADIYLGAGENILNGQSLNSSVVSLIASESTLSVGGGGVVYNIPFDSGTSGEWVSLALVPEPGQITLLAGLATLVFGLFARGPQRDVFLKIFGKFILCRIPPHRD